MWYNDFMTVEAFIKKYNFIPKIDNVYERILYDMNLGLFEDKSKAGQDMFNTWILPPKNKPKNKKIIVIDAGGTNFRSCLITFDEKGDVTISDFRKTSMPGIEKELSKKEIEYFIEKYTNGEVTDYQAAALVMAIYINGMDYEVKANQDLRSLVAGKHYILNLKLNGKMTVSMSNVSVEDWSEGDSFEVLPTYSGVTGWDDVIAEDGVVAITKYNYLEAANFLYENPQITTLTAYGIDSFIGQTFSELKKLDTESKGSLAMAAFSFELVYWNILTSDIRYKLLEKVVLEVHEARTGQLLFLDICD